jgi:predicted small lipoprotein YifL
MKPLIRTAALAALIAGSVSLAGCGKQGVLERPAPLFGREAKAQYEAEKAAEAKASAAAAARRDGKPVDNSDNVRTTSEVRDPAQVLTPARSAPVVGAPSGPGGAPPSLTPPN